MSKQLEDTFNLAPAKPIVDQATQSLLDILKDDTIPDDIKDKVDAALSQVRGLTDDMEIDDLIKEAKESYKDLMDAANNMDPRFSGKLFEVAATMLKNAIDLQVHKNDRKLRVVDMQIKKQRLDMQRAAQDGGAIPGSAKVIDRNELLRQRKDAKTDK
jgi:vacuolar-type H+-ATPase subunit H